MAHHLNAQTQCLVALRGDDLHLPHHCPQLMTKKMNRTHLLKYNIVFFRKVIVDNTTWKKKANFNLIHAPHMKHKFQGHCFSWYF